ncbi:MAG TPA: lytic murein transglycosylase [Syntrophales bacterium]|nr:lytic murein transglycosylase [Syntrophales bacterium]
MQRRSCLLPEWCLPLLFLLMVFGFPTALFAEWGSLTARLAADGYDEKAVQALFLRPEVRFDPSVMSSKVDALLRRRAAFREKGDAARPSGVRKGYLRSHVIAYARMYASRHRDLLEEVRKVYGVPKEVVVAILLVETRLGRYMGGRSVFNSLASMARSRDLTTVQPHLSRALLTAEELEFAREKCRQKAEWAYEELKALLLYAGNCGIDPLEIRGSVYGALGLCQFMPTSIRDFGIDGNGDGRVDLFSEADALHSTANYLRGHGWKAQMDPESQRRVLFEYNNSAVYVNTVLAVAAKLRNRI